MSFFKKTAGWMYEKAFGFPPWNPTNFPYSPGFGSYSLAGGACGSVGGIPVSGVNALAVSAIWACVRIRSQMLGHFPLNVFRYTPNGIKLADAHPLYSILHDSPNAYMTSMEWRQAMSVAFDLFGNAFSQIARLKKDGTIVGLNPLDSQRMTIKYENGELWYEYMLPQSSTRVRLEQDEVLHIRNFSLDGIVGLNPIEQQRQSVGLGLAQQRYGAALYLNGGRPAGVLEHPAKLDKPAVDRLRESWEQIHASPDNAGKVAILWEGMKYNAVGLSPQDAEYIEARKFQLSEFARIYGVQPHLIADLDRSTNNNIEQQGIEAVVYGFAPLCTLWEQRMKKSLLTSINDKDCFIRFNLAALMRGDAAARSAFYSQMVQNGIMSRDEARQLEELPLRGGGADDLTVQSNMLDLDALAKLSKPAPPVAAPAALPAAGGKQ